MKHNPHITFIADTEPLFKSKEIVSEFVPFLKSNGYEYRYPFGEDLNVDAVKKQILQDAEHFHLLETCTKIQLMWESFVSNNQVFKEYPLFSQDFTCVLTMYGPRGFFYTPDTVYVNITFDSGQAWLQTMLHEMLHLVHFEETKKMTHSEREGFIDDKFIELWGDVFPEYSEYTMLAKR